MVITIMYFAQHGTWPAKDLFARVKSLAKLRIHFNKSYYREDTAIVGYRLQSDALLIFLYRQEIKTIIIMIIIIILIIVIIILIRLRKRTGIVKALHFCLVFNLL